MIEWRWLEIWAKKRNKLLVNVARVKKGKSRSHIQLKLSEFHHKTSLWKIDCFTLIATWWKKCQVSASISSANNDKHLLLKQLDDKWSKKFFSRHRQRGIYLRVFPPCLHFCPSMFFFFETFCIFIESKLKKKVSNQNH